MEAMGDERTGEDQLQPWFLEEAIRRRERLYLSWY